MDSTRGVSSPKTFIPVQGASLRELQSPPATKSEPQQAPGDAVEFSAFRPPQEAHQPPQPMESAPPAPREAPPAPAVQIPGTDSQSVLVNGAGNTFTSISILEDTPALTPANAALIDDIRSSFREFPQLATVLEKFVADTSHPMNIVAYMKDEKMRPFIFSELKDMARLKRVKPEALPGVVAATFNPDVPLLQSDDAGFTLSEGRKRPDILKEELAGRDPVYSVDDRPTAEQMDSLRTYAGKLRKSIQPALTEKLESLVADMPHENGFPAVNARSKTAEGIVDKIHRAREGRDGKPPISDYTLADMPDAVGGRITVTTPDQVQTVMKRLEAAFGKENIYEKDCFYSNPKKRERSYRVITYTVLVDNVPCEVQVTTLKASMAADLGHNTVYKKLHPDLPQSTLDYINTLQSSIAAEEHRMLAQN